MTKSITIFCGGSGVGEAAINHNELITSLAAKMTADNKNDTWIFLPGSGAENPKNIPFDTGPYNHTSTKTKAINFIKSAQDRYGKIEISLVGQSRGAAACIDLTNDKTITELVSSGKVTVENVITIEPSLEDLFQLLPAPPIRQRIINFFRYCGLFGEKADIFQVAGHVKNYTAFLGTRNGWWLDIYIPQFASPATKVTVHDAFPFDHLGSVSVETESIEQMPETLHRLAHGNEGTSALLRPVNDNRILNIRNAMEESILKTLQEAGADLMADIQAEYAAKNPKVIQDNLNVLKTLEDAPCRVWTFERGEPMRVSSAREWYHAQHGPSEARNRLKINARQEMVNRSFYHTASIAAGFYFSQAGYLVAPPIMALFIMFSAEATLRAVKQNRASGTLLWCTTFEAMRMINSHYELGGFSMIAHGIAGIAGSKLLATLCHSALPSAAKTIKTTCGNVAKGWPELSTLVTATFLTMLAILCANFITDLGRPIAVGLQLAATVLNGLDHIWNQPQQAHESPRQQLAGQRRADWAGLLNIICASLPFIIMTMQILGQSSTVSENANTLAYNISNIDPSASAQEPIIDFTNELTKNSARFFNNTCPATAYENIALAHAFLGAA